MDDEVASLSDITSVLDPRFKTKYVKQVEDVLVRVREEGASIVHQSKEQQCESTKALASATLGLPRKKKI